MDPWKWEEAIGLKLVNSMTFSAPKMWQVTPGEEVFSGIMVAFSRWVCVRVTYVFDPHRRFFANQIFRPYPPDSGVGGFVVIIGGGRIVRMKGGVIVVPFHGGGGRSP